ncbi:hypothetical protein ES703_109219 [subsurface metagenome]
MHVVLWVVVVDPVDHGFPSDDLLRVDNVLQLAYLRLQVAVVDRGDIPDQVRGDYVHGHEVHGLVEHLEPDLLGSQDGACEESRRYGDAEEEGDEAPPAPDEAFEPVGEHLDLAFHGLPKCNQFQSYGRGCIKEYSGQSLGVFPAPI